MLTVSPKWVTRPKDMVSGIGGDAMFPCTATGFPNPQVEWFKVKGNNTTCNESAFIYELI